MCGIVCAVLKSSSPGECINQVLSLIRSSRFSKRGPDACCYAVIQCGEYQVVIVAGLLSLRGPVTPQPLHDNHRALAFNGEIYRFGEDGEFDAENENDTRFLWRQLTNVTTEDHVWRVFEKVEGPYAFVFADEFNQSVLFGRDILGRRSLLIGKPKVADGHSSIVLLLSSVALARDVYNWTEVESGALFRLALNFNNDLVISERKWHWKSTLQSIVNDHFSDELEANATCENNHLQSVLTSFNCSLTDFEPYSGGRAQNVEERLTLLRNALENETINGHVRELQSVLEQAVRQRVACIQSNSRNTIGLLFSGGVDSTVLALLVSTHVPPEVPIELINVSFNDLPSNSNSNDDCYSQDEGAQVFAAISPFLSDSYERQRCVFQTDIAARLAAANNSSLALTQTQTQTSKVQLTRTPDRISAIEAYGELVQLHTERDWRLVLVDVSRDELNIVKRQGVLDQLGCPRSSIFDENLCASLWYAARGRGHIYRDNMDESRQNYVSQSRVLLLGSGIDEQLVGYTRHRRVYAQGGMRTLVREMALELSRLGERNLGRDDRAVADHGREARLPYLDERVVRLIAALPLAARANLNMPRGVGEKLLLRTLAFNLGLRATAVRDKKAMQFGTHIVRISESKRLAKAHVGGVFDQREPVDDD